MAHGWKLCPLAVVDVDADVDVDVDVGRRCYGQMEVENREQKGQKG